jgi:putative ABC transport system permease protein
VGMALSAQSALVSFSKAIEYINGHATHSMERLAGPIEENLLQELMNDPSLEAFSPVIDRKLRLSSNKSVRLLGVDQFLDRRVRPEIYHFSDNKDDNFISKEFETVLSLIANPYSCIIDSHTALSLHIKIGNLISTSRGTLKVVGIFSSSSPEPLFIMDIGNAQHLFGLQGFVDRIDLVLSDEKAFFLHYKEGFKIQSLQQKTRIYTGMLSSFKLNLEALSLIALFVGVFLIYNTTMFTVVSRKRDAGILRSLGAGRGEVALAYLSEILILGSLGGLIGGVLGFYLSRLLTYLVGQTISNLYFFLVPSPLPWTWSIVVISVFFGCSASLLGSIFPLADFMRINPIEALHGRIPARRSAHSMTKSAIAGIVTLTITSFLLLFWSHHIYVGLTAAFGLLLGFSLLSALLVCVTNPPLKYLLSLFFGLPGKTAASNIRQNIGRTSVAIAAFMVALSMTIGLGSMIDSFRQSLMWWMETQLKADIYIGSTTDGFEVPEKFFDELNHVPRLGDIDPYRNIQVIYQGKSVSLAAVSSRILQKHTHFGWLDGNDENWTPVMHGAVVVSESFARNFNKHRGDIISITSRHGPVDFMISGVFYDYTTEHGLIMMDRATYLSTFDDHRINSIGVFLDPHNPDRVKLLENVIERSRLLGLPTYSLPDLSKRILTIFDSTFSVTKSMRILAIIVAFFGIAGALVTLFMERQREFGIYRALGFSLTQVALMTVIEGLGMGIISFLGSVVAGTALAVMLIKIINLQSFNWTIFYYPSIGPYILAGVIAILASVCAAIYPLWMVIRRYPHMQLREE